ncbi:MAG: hypothetical protein H7A25_07310 [Leptospiraceae bacterium]|nr:hypothetical protein [Leptospiraceae bacterium]MCP5499692.1 hypothetical protein [Leptospiraceae bacterium]
MKKFKFHLESVLKLRETRVEKELSELAQVVGKINKLQNEIDSNNNNINREIRTYESKVVTGENLRYFRMFGNYIKGLYLKNDELKRYIEEEQDHLQEARSRVVEAKKDKEVIETIKKKREEEFLDRLRKLERYEEEEINGFIQKSHVKEIEDGKEKRTGSIDSFLEEEDEVELLSENKKTNYDILQDFIKSSQRKRR